MRRRPRNNAFRGRRGTARSSDVPYSTASFVSSRNAPLGEPIVVVVVLVVLVVVVGGAVIGRGYTDRRGVCQPTRRPGLGSEPRAAGVSQSRSESIGARNARLGDP